MIAKLLKPVIELPITENPFNICYDKIEWADEDGKFIHSFWGDYKGFVVEITPTNYGGSPCEKRFTFGGYQIVSKDSSGKIFDKKELKKFRALILALIDQITPPSTTKDRTPKNNP